MISEAHLPEAAGPYLAPSSSFSTLDGMRIHHVDEGDGPPLVLLHGSGWSLHVFDALAERLEASFRVVRLDLPGFGLTGPRPDGDYSVRAYVSLLHRFTSTQIGRPFLLAGHSFGGQIAWNFALDHPDDLDGLVLMNATGYPEKALPLPLRLARIPILRPILRRTGSRSATARQLSGLVGPGSRAVNDALIDRVYTIMSLPGNRGAVVDFANTDQVDRSSQLAQINVPTLVLRSDLVEGQHFATDIPTSSEVVLNGVGHLMPAEAPAAVAEAITTFANQDHREGL